MAALVDAYQLLVRWLHESRFDFAVVVGILAYLAVVHALHGVAQIIRLLAFIVHSVRDEWRNVVRTWRKLIEEFHVR